MANPQRENGHIDIANEIAEQLAKTQLSGYESRVLWVLWRKTYGWHKRSDRISISQFSMGTGIARRHIHKTLQRLVDRNIVTKNSNKFITRWAFQKDYSKWKVVTKNSNKDKLVTENGTRVQKSVTRFVTDFGAHKRKLTKETKYTKESTITLSQINNLISTFPSNLQSLINEYIDIARLQNKTEKISLYRQKRLIDELLLLWQQYDTNNDIDEADYRNALKITVNNHAPDVNYVRKVIQGIVNKRSIRIKGVNK